MSGELHNWEDVKAELDRKRNQTGLAGAWYWTTYAGYRVRDKIRDVPRQIKWAHQRVFRGWDDRAVWSLDSHLTRVLGQQLIVMSEIAHGYPGEEIGWTYERWVGELHQHGEALLAYSTQFEHDMDDWERLYVPAREALLWVAENLSMLWD